MKIHFFFCLLFCALLVTCKSKKTISESPKAEKTPTVLDHVNPFIGTGGHGHTYPGATMPFGMVQLSPDTRLDGWDGCGGYHYTDSIIYGFSHTHLQGTGISDYGDILIMPTNSQTKVGNQWNERYNSSFRKETETASPGYYAVTLDDHQTEVELTCSERVGIHKYHLNNETDSFTVFMDMAHRDPLIEYQFYPLNDSTLAGMRSSKEWAEEQRVYFVAEFSRPFYYQDQTYEVIENSTDSETGNATQEIELVPIFPLVFDSGADLMVKIAISGVDIDGALQNLRTEADHWDFEKYKTDAEKAWLKELSGITIATQSEEILTNFYTSLYHSYTVPNNFTDTDGRYRGMDKKIHQAENHTQYTVFSLWDTFRASHPLYTITQRKRTRDFIHSFLKMYDQGGDLPMWELAGNYTHCMIGYNAVPVIADAYAKGIMDFDNNKALEAMVSTSQLEEFGKPYFRKNGYISMEDEGESVSKNLEYSYNDWCIASMAEKMGASKMPLAEVYYRSSQNYRNTIDSELGFARAKRNGNWLENFDPAEVNFNFTEANSFQYSFFVPHDVEGMIEHVGGEKRFNELLDQLFTTSPDLAGRHQPDITGLIGQYAHGNEPSHHMAYLYNYSGQPWKTQERTQEILHDLYQPQPDGLCGNEDCGQMSSWYVLSALGIYSVTPGSSQYALSVPIVDSASVRLENGKVFRVATQKNGSSQGTQYIQSVTYNGEPWPHCYLEHDMIMNGGKLVFELGSEPNKTWAINDINRPYSQVQGYDITYAPVIEAERSFLDENLVSIKSEKGARTEYRLKALDTSGDESTDAGKWEDWQVYTDPFTIDESTMVQARSQKQVASSSGVVQSELIKRKADWKIELFSEYNNQYTAGGELALIDGIRSRADFKSGDYQGYWGNDMVAVVDLGSKTAVESIYLSCLTDTKPWIFPPKSVKIEVSNDNENWTEFTFKTIELPEGYEEVNQMLIGAEDFTLCRYVRVTAENWGPMPEWHISSGEQPWIFVDEIIID